MESPRGGARSDVRRREADGPGASGGFVKSPIVALAALRLASGRGLGAEAAKEAYLMRGLTSGDGVEIVAIQTQSPGLAESSWPSLRHDNRGTMWLTSLPP
jgi:hypothetical protein